MKKMEKHLKRVLSIMLVAVLLAQAAWTPTTSSAADSNEATANSDVYVSASGSDSAVGTEAAPLKTLEKAFEVVANGGTIHIVGTVETGSWSAHGKNITITGGTEGTLNFTTGNKTLGGLGDTLTFSNINLGIAATNQRLFANGCKLTIGDGVTTTNKPYLYGGCPTYKGTFYGDSHLEVYSGEWGRIYGGGNDASTQNGSTYVTVGGAVNAGLDVTDHDLPHAIYGAGMGDTITGSTNVTVTGHARAIYVYGGASWSSHGAPVINGGTNVTVTGNAQVMSVMGGSNFGGSTGLTAELDTNVLVNGGTIEQIFGGNNKANLTGNVDVRVLGGTVSRRIYGGCYNEAGSGTTYSVTGNIKLTIGGDAQITFAVGDDQGIYARSRKDPKSDNEVGTIVFDDETAYNTYNAKLGAHDWGAEYVMGDVTAADYVHYFTYTADDEANTITATCNLCAEVHSATATLSAVKNEFAYTGNSIEGAQISYDDTWNAAPLEIVYTDNVEEGTATATCTKNGASVSVSFKIQSTVLSGKTISILGDSISTFGGVSNNANINKTIGKNNVYYTGGSTASSKVVTQEDTYWGTLIEKYGMNLCVNNSTGGGKVAVDVGTDGVRPSAIKRSTELHNNDGQEPDIIIVYLGTNDISDTSISLNTFSGAYKQMLENILEKYENAELFCFTLLPGRDYATYETKIYAYNEQIKKIVSGYEDRVNLVDIYTESGIAWNNLDLYYTDHTGNNLHPNATGMEKMAKVLERALLDAYEPASLPNTPDTYFDLDIDLENKKAVNVGTNQNTVIEKIGKGVYKTIEIVREGQKCEVPVFYVEQDYKDGDGTAATNSYLDVNFKDITQANKPGDAWGKWILDGITFECFFYVKSHPTQTSGIMSSCWSGGVTLYGVNSQEGTNFLIGSNDTSNDAGTYEDNGNTRYKYSKTYSAATKHYSSGKPENVFNAGSLTHLVGTYDKETNMMAIYLDGELIEAGSYGDVGFELGKATAGKLGIGANASYTTECLDDTTDYAIVDARVYSGGLTAEQVKQEYNNRWNEVLETATGPDVYFDLDFQDGEAVSVGTNKDNTTITPYGAGNFTTMSVLHNGQVCEVPVFSAPKDGGTASKTYLDVAFSNITTDDQMKSWIFDNGISFECFIYVDELPKGTAGFMTNLNSGGIGFYTYEQRGELNFRMGSTKARTATYPFNSTYMMAFPSQNSNTNLGDNGATSIIKNLQLAQEYQTFNVGKLTHVVGTYDMKNNVMSIYKDGELISSGTYSEGGKADFKRGSALLGRIGLGCNIAYTSSGEWLSKLTEYAIADARVYSSALTAEQVAEQYNNRWNEVATHAVSSVTQLDDLSGYTSITEGSYQELEELPSYYYGSETFGTYEGSNTGDRAVIGDNDYTLHVFSNTTHAAYVSYLKSLEADGWTQYSNNIIEENNLFATYTKGDKSVYAYYIASKASTYIVASNTSYLENREADNQYEEICDPLFTELKNISSSQCEILRLSDGRFIIIDSGMTETNHYQAERIYEVLEEQNVLDKITVAAWIITHPHTDHMNACADFLTYYGSGDLDIEEIIFNYPNKTDREAADSGLATTVPVFFNGLATAMEKWPEMKIITCHTGQEYYIADATIEILHTVEDYFPKKVNNATDKINDSSVAFKIKIAGQEIMILGDSGTSVSNDLVGMWGDYLKSDFVQMSHHGMHGGSVELYEHIDPTVVTIPATRGLWDPENTNYIANYDATAWVLNNISNNIKEVSIAGLGTRTFVLPYIPKNANYISNINDNGYEMEEPAKVQADIPEPYMDLVFDGTTVTDGGTADNTLEMIGGSVGENTVYYNGKPYTVTSYRGEKTSSDYNYIHLTMNDVDSADDLKTLLVNGHTLEMFFALDNELPRIGGLMASCYSGGVALYARKLGVVGYQLGNTAGNANTYYNSNYAAAADMNATNTGNMAVGKTVTHVVATYDKTEGMLKLYQNGVLISEGTYNNPEKYKGHADAYAEFFNQMGIGANVAAPHEAIGRETGYTVIKSRIYSESLSAEQVASEYWSCIEDLTGDEDIYDDWNPEEADTYKKVTVPFTKTEVETFLSNGTHPTRKGYLFGGWYTTKDIPEIDADNYEESAEEAMKVAIQDTVPDGVETVYALFVPEEVLTVKAQISGNLIDKDDTNDATGSIRFVTTVDSLMYKRVGFKVEYVNSQSVNKTIISDSKTVYEKLSAVDVNGNVVKELTYLPTQFCSVSKYFKACTIADLLAANFSREFTVTPFWETMDGSVVYGEPVVKSINQYLETLK